MTVLLMVWVSLLILVCVVWHPQGEALFNVRVVDTDA